MLDEIHCMCILGCSVTLSDLFISVLFQVEELSLQLIEKDEVIQWFEGHNKVIS